MSDQPYSGVGGRTRESKTMDAVDEAVTGGPAHPAATPTTPETSGVKAHPAVSGYAPSGDTGPRVYGAPMSAPILKGGSV